MDGFVLGTSVGENVGITREIVGTGVLEVVGTAGASDEKG